MGPEALAQVLRPLAGMFAAADHPNVLRGLETPDDAGVYRLDDDRAIVITADFFPPVVDDPFDFGRIAAANALSDLYAMGARPLCGINLVAFPDSLDPEILSTILRGGGEAMRQAGAPVVGGHTTSDPEPKYGLAVVGEVHPGRVLAKGGARAGDALVLTKPLGSGAVTTALKRGTAEAGDVRAAVESMARLNAAASAVFREAGDAVHALTDVTGFGLVGHAHEMATQSGVALSFDTAALDVLPGALRYLREGAVPGGARRNREYYAPFTAVADGIDPALVDLLWDPQTSGGLLAAVDPSEAESILERLLAAGEPARRIGAARAGEAGTIELR